MYINRIFSLLLAMLLCADGLSAQVIWQENFNYPNTTSVGANNNTANPSLDWTSSCPTCAAGDWFWVVNNRMEGSDTNGPAVLVTESIDISAALHGVEVRVDLSEDGTMEGCPGGYSSGCNSIDWIRIEYKLDNGAYQSWTSPLGGTCLGDCAGANYVTIDDFGSYQFVQCPVLGDSIRLRISVQCWASNEFLRIDGITILPQTCRVYTTSDSLVPPRCNGGSDGEIWLQTTNGIPPYSYSLNGGPFQPGNSFTGLPAGSYTVIVNDAVGALDTLNIVLNDPPAITLNMSAVPSGCAGPTGIAVVTTNGGTPGYTYQWNTNPAQTTATATSLGPGLYIVTVTDTLGCQAVDSINVGQTSTIGVTAGPDRTVCAGQGILLDVTGQGGAGNYTYQWWCDSLQAPCALDSLNDDDPLASPGQTTTYYVQATDQTGCTSLVDSLVVTVNEAPTASAGPDTLACPGFPLVLQGSATGAGPAYTYSWAPAAGLSDPLVAQPTATPAQTTAYVLTVTSNGCPSLPDTVVLTVLPGPTVIGPRDTVLCLGDTLRVNAQGFPAIGGNLSYVWTGPTGNFPTDSSYLETVPFATASYTVSVMEAGACPSLPDTFQVKVEIPFQHDVPVGMNFCPGEPLQIGVPAQNGYTYAWSPITGLEDWTQSQTMVAPEESIVYTLAVTNDTMESVNCRTQRYPVALVAEPCILPNVITPNGDGNNDRLDLGQHLYPVRLEVYDRWGRLVFEDDNYQNEWTGKTSSGADLPEGVYYYVVRTHKMRGPEGVRGHQMSDLTILR